MQENTEEENAISTISLSFRGKNVQHTLQRHLDKSRGRARPRKETVASELSTITCDERWKLPAGLTKIEEWFSIRLRTEETVQLNKWFDCETRDKVQWTKAMKTELALVAMLATCQNDSIKPPFKVQDIPFVAFKNWNQMYFTSRLSAAKKKKKADTIQATEKELHDASYVTCTRCCCTCEITSSGRGLKNIKPCSRHKNKEPTAQLFLRDYQGQFLPFCAHCMVQCERCGCLALRSHDLVRSFDACTTLCRRGHVRSQVEFRVRRRRVPLVEVQPTNVIPGSALFVLATCCVECDGARNKAAQQTYKENKKKNLKTPPPAAVATPLTLEHRPLSSPLPVLRNERDDRITPEDGRVAVHYLKYLTIKNTTDKRTFMQHVGTKEQVVYARVEYMMTVLCPRLYKQAQKQCGTTEK